MLRVLRGEPLEVVARELAVTAADLSGWRDAFLEAGEASLKSRARDDRDERIERLQSKLGEVLMDNELLCTKVERLEGGAPWSCPRGWCDLPPLRWLFRVLRGSWVNLEGGVPGSGA